MIYTVPLVIGLLVMVGALELLLNPFLELLVPVTLYVASADGDIELLFMLAVSLIV